jgi:undecaprenyl-diphosphatase
VAQGAVKLGVWLSAAWLLALCGAFAVDQPVARLMANASPATLKIFGVITWFGQGGVILYPAAAVSLVAACVLRLAPDRRAEARMLLTRAAVIFAVVAAAGLVNDALKILFGRARPYLWLAGDHSGFTFLRYGAKFASFPSGHTATSVAAAVVLTALFPKGRWFFLAFALVIGLSRIVLDAHYVSDVVAGAAVGGAIALKMLDRMNKSGWTGVRSVAGLKLVISRPKPVISRDQ